MAKIILTVDGTILKEIPLSKERITIGRRAHNDIVIDGIAISAEHAAIVTVQSDSYLEDLNSTNGTQINGQPVRKHFLQDNDVIELAQYQLRYVANPSQVAGQAVDALMRDTEAMPSVNAQAGQRENALATEGTESEYQKSAVIKILNGANAGKEIVLEKALTTIGRPGVQVAVISHRMHGYSITHVEGENYPSVNGKSIGTRAHLLKYDDVIDLSEIRMAFLAG